MPDVATGAAWTPFESALQALAKAIRGDAPAPGSMTGQDIDLSPTAPASVAPAPTWTAQRAFLHQPPPTSGQLPRGTSPGLFERAMLASQGALGLGNMGASDYSTPEGQQAAAQAGGLGELAGLLGPLLMGGVGMIKAYHGSPHDFDAFDFSKIGTGEGSAAYGHGGYFAEHPDVARSYKPDAAVGNAAAARQVRRGQAPTGRMYEVNIHADPAQLLDWEKPLSQQSPEVQQAIAPLMEHPQLRSVMSHYTFTPEEMQDASGKLLYELLSDVRAAERHGSSTAAIFARHTTGEAARREREASESLQALGIPGHQYLDQGSRGAQMADRWTVTNHAADGHAINSLVFPSETEAQAYMKSRAYKQQAKQFGYATSQVELTPAKADVTRNIVMYPGTEHLIEIVKKYGVALPVAAEIFRRQQQEGQ